MTLSRPANTVMAVNSQPNSAAIVLAAGSGQRFGAKKQFELIGNVTLLDRVVATARSTCDAVVVVVPADYKLELDVLPSTWADGAVHAVVRGGASHGESAKIGLAALPTESEIVVLTAASHPLAGPELYRQTVAKVAEGFDAAAPLAPIADAIKQRQGDVVIGSVNKTNLVTVQSPGAFNRLKLEQAYQMMEQADADHPPEELEMIERVGGSIALIEGEATNLHVTRPIELEMARRFADLV